MIEEALMTSLTRDIWGRDFNLPVRFEDLDDEGITENQWAAYGRIIIKWAAIDGSLAKVKQYCQEQDSERLGDRAIDNIFRYVMPQYLFVSETEDQRQVALMCNYRFDPEHGLAIVFENEKLVGIGPQDIIL